MIVDCGNICGKIEKIVRLEREKIGVVIDIDPTLMVVLCGLKKSRDGGKKYNNKKHWAA